MWKSNNFNFNDAEEFFLHNMGKDSMAEVEEMFTKSQFGEYQINNLAAAADLVHENPDREIIILGDYDVDGIVSTVILMRVLQERKVSYMIPKRFSEGYGFNKSMFDRIKSNMSETKPILILVDNGITCIDEIKEAKDMGCLVIVLDHHLPKTENGKVILPPADVIVDPHVTGGDFGGDFEDYCGAGLALRFAREYDGETYEMRTLAAVGTIADCVPLHEENYVIVKQGLQSLNENRGNLGLIMLSRAVTKDSRHIEADNIGFGVGPCINASSRLNDEGAKDVIEFLLDPTEEELKVLLANNEKRKKLTEVGKKLADKAIASLGSVPVPAVIYLPDVEMGIAGIIAGYVAEKYNTPTYVFTDNRYKDGYLAGSGRSACGYVMVDALAAVKVEGLSFGGHPSAAGVGIPKESLESFAKAVTETCPVLGRKKEDEKTYDLVLFPDEMKDALKEYERFAPYGEGNPNPVYRIDDIEAAGYKKSAKYGKIESPYAKIVTFSPADFTSLFTEEPDFVNVLGTISPDYFRTNVPNVQVQLVDVTFDTAAVLSKLGD